MTMMSFRIVIVFKGVGESGEMRDTLSYKKLCKILVFISIIRVKGDDFAIKVFFHKSLKSNKYIMNLGFLLKRIKLNILCKVINKDNIVFQIILRDNKRSPHIREKNFKWLGRDKR